MNDERERLARLEAKHAAICEDLAEIKRDMREVRDAIVGAKAGWRMLMAGAALMGGLAGWASKFLPMIGKG